MARRRDDWSFLLADSDDMGRLLRLTIDEETVLMRVEDELVDVAALHCAYDAYEDVVPMMQAARTHALAELGNVSSLMIEN